MSHRWQAFLLTFAQFSAILGVLGSGPIRGLLWPAWSVLVLVVAWIGWAFHALGPGNATVLPLPRKQHVLVYHGPYRFVRHPMYTGVLLAALACALGAPRPWRWAWTLVLVGVLIAKIRFEEQALVEKYGSGPLAKLPRWRLVPGLW
ncbi:MAG: hypothetical protein KDB88_09360 [Flavobacteriales bacterium]|nr:hypothetical protein [Flavobacteriales bacterium]